MSSSSLHAPHLDAGVDFAGRYRVIRRLKQGGMGSVYEVLDRTTDRLRALKIMQPQIAADADLRMRFEQEASIVGRVRSDHIVEVMDAGISESDSTPFLVMELLHGDDLGSLLTENGPFDAARTVNILSQVAMGLDKVHAEGIIHRDLKLENLFMTTRDDGTPHVKILDFGVAKMIGHLATLSTTRSLGTPLYMAPEQLSGDGTIGGSADLYSLAHVAFCMLVGKPYWFDEARNATNAYAFISKVVDGLVEPARARASRYSVTLPEAFDDWFAKAAARRADQRFESAAEQVSALADALDVPLSVRRSRPMSKAASVPGAASPTSEAFGAAAFSTTEISAPGISALERPASKPSRRGLLALGLGLGLLGLLVWRVSSGTDPDVAATSASVTAASASMPFSSASMPSSSAAEPSATSSPAASANAPPSASASSRAPASPNPPSTVRSAAPPSTARAAPPPRPDVPQPARDPLDEL